MLSSTSSKNQKIVPEGCHEIISIGNEEYTQYMASPLITCFAYLILFQTNDNRQKAILYHSLSGIPNALEDIFNEIRSDFKSLDQVIIALSGSRTNPTIKKIVQNAVDLITTLFMTNRNQLNITLVDDAPCYTMDTLGNHGILIPSLKRQHESKRMEFIFEYLKDLERDILTIPFTITNWLGNEVPGKPKGVKALAKHLEKLNIAKSNPKMLESIFTDVMIEFDIIKNRTSDNRTSVVSSFYHEQLTKLSNLRNSLNQSNVRPK